MRPENPIRNAIDKTKVDDQGIPKCFAHGPRTMAVELDDELLKKVEKGAFIAHNSLGARDFSLYDVRVSPEGEPYFLEASLYCSFAPRSIVVQMAGSANEKDLILTNLFSTLVDRAVKRKFVRSGQVQVLGMLGH